MEPQSASKQTATIGFNIRGSHLPPLHFKLDEEFGILCRVGSIVHLRHHTMVHFGGLHSFWIGVFNTMDDIDQAYLPSGKLPGRYNERFPCGDPGGFHQSRTAD
jgi:hypothetical protein